MNSTTPQHLPIAKYILGGMDLVLIVFGIFGNQVIIVVTINRNTVVHIILRALNIFGFFQIQMIKLF